MNLHHINCGSMHAPPHPRAICHCLLLEAPAGLALIDTGIGLLEVRDPAGRIGQALIDLVGLQFREADTAVRQIERLGLSPADVAHVVLTHADPDHAGGLADFPRAHVHISDEELASVNAGHFRYLPRQFAHGPRWAPHAPSPRRWFGLEARPSTLAPGPRCCSSPSSATRAATAASPSARASGGPSTSGTPTTCASN